MNRRTGNLPKRIIAAGLALIVLIVLSSSTLPFQSLFEKVGLISAGIVMPEGSKSYIYQEYVQNLQHQGTASDTQPIDNDPEPESERASEPATEAPTSETVSSAPESSGTANVEKGGNIVEKTFKGGGSNLNWNNVWVQNKTASHTVNIEKTLKEKVSLNLSKKNKPYVLIYHTHTSESYQDKDTGWYPKGYNSRSLDKNKNMIRVGNAIAEKLEAAGIGVIHVTDYFDYPSYNGGYDRSGAMIDKYLKKYPTIKVLLDIHRDAIQYDDGTKAKPTATINGKKAAQIMIISGCEEGAIKDFPDWEYNLRFALQLQKTGADHYPDLMRPLYFGARRYNMYKTRTSLLIEMGTDGNTLGEAVYSGQLLGDILVKNLSKYT